MNYQLENKDIWIGTQKAKEILGIDKKQWDRIRRKYYVNQAKTGYGEYLYRLSNLLRSLEEDNKKYNLTE